jgi:prepilin-type N-terminal cleavage/methylation domain-containing protein
MHRRSRHLRGFTLVELLVVIGIIVVLIGVLLPVLSGVAARGRDVQCQSNIRQAVQRAGARVPAVPRLVRQPCRTRIRIKVCGANSPACPLQRVRRAW